MVCDGWWFCAGGRRRCAVYVRAAGNAIPTALPEPLKPDPPPSAAVPQNLAKMSGMFYTGMMCSDSECNRIIFFAEACAASPYFESTSHPK